MSNPITSDPADRLIRILGKAQELKGGTFLTVWSKIGQVNEDDVIGIYRVVNSVAQLVDDVERAILLMPDVKHELYLKPLKPIRLIISRVNLHEQWQPHQPVLEMALHALEYCSERLQKTNSEGVIDQMELDELRKQVDDLLTSLSSSEKIDPKLKLLLQDLLAAILRSIQGYAFRGVRGMRQELFTLFSQLQENYTFLSEHKDEEPVKGFFALLEKIDKVTATTMKVREVLNHAAPLFQLLPHVASKLTM
jgi:hypothetical protein